MCDRTSDPTTYDLPEVCAICDRPESEHGNVDQHQFMDAPTWRDVWMGAPTREFIAAELEGVIVTDAVKAFVERAMAA
jgi:hypothetical protein